jgi:hypothetical protein
MKWKVIEEKIQDKLTGSYFLRTNRTDLEAKELWQLYNVLRSVEDAFRFMKSSLGLRPVYHQKEHRVDGHLWITILAYHLIQPSEAIKQLFNSRCSEEFASSHRENGELGVTQFDRHLAEVSIHAQIAKSQISSIQSYRLVLNLETCLFVCRNGMSLNDHGKFELVHGLSIQ